MTRQLSSYRATPKPQTARDGLQGYSMLLQPCSWKEESATGESEVAQPILAAAHFKMTLKEATAPQ